MRQAMTATSEVWPSIAMDRYARHRSIGWWDQDAVASSSVLVVGCGALGSEAVKLLALVGMGRIIVVDPDRIELHNLTRGVFFRAGDVGRWKARVTAQRARMLNPDVVVEAIVGRVEDRVGLGLLQDMSMVICCLDSIGGRVAVSRMCYRAGTPWVNGGISPTAGEVSAFGASVPPCYVCGVSERMWERERLSFTCRGFSSEVQGVPAPTTAMTASVVASMQVQHTLARICASSGAPGGLEDGQKALMSLSPPSMSVTTLMPDPECGSHERWQPAVRLSLGPSRLTARGLLRRCGQPDGVLDLPCEVLDSVRCVGCGRVRQIGAPLRACSESVLACPDCGAPDGDPRVISSVLPGDPEAGLPLSRLGVCRRQILRVQTGEHAAPLYVEIG